MNKTKTTSPNDSLYSFKRMYIWVIPIVLLGYYLIFYLTQSCFILPDFFKLQRDYSIKNISRIKETIFNSIDSLSNMVSDWAMWDDTYVFVKDGNKKYITSNLIPRSLWKSSKINLVYIYNTKGRVIWYKLYDPIKNELLHLKKFPLKQIPRNDFLLSPQVLKSGFKGLLTTRYGIMLVAAAPVLKSSGEGPSRGILMMGRFITQNIMRKLWAQTKISFSLIMASNPSSQSNISAKILSILQHKGIYFDTKYNKNLWIVYTILYDIYNNPIIIKSSIGTPFVKEGYKLSFVVSIAILTMITILLIVLLIIFKKYDFIRQRQYNYINKLVEEKTKEIKIKTKILNVFMNNVSDMIFVRDENARYILYNKAFKEAFNIESSNEEPIDEPFLYVKCPEMFSLIRKYAEGELKSYNRYQQEMWVRCPVDNEKHYLDITLFPINLSGNKGIICVVRDLTERENIRLERERIRRIDSLGTLAGGIAHDFNNLLTSILANISLAKEYLKGDIEVTHRLKLAEEAALGAKELALQLLTFSREGDLTLQVTSIRELVERTAHFVLTGQNIGLEIKEEGEQPWTVLIDTRQIGQVIQNLIINAREAMPGGGTITITFKNVEISDTSTLPLSPGKYVQISIKDEGKGIAPEHLSKIFEPYFTTKDEGTGLGLAICYSIIRRHEGYITVDSVEGKGTRFDLYLPASPVSQPHRKEVRDAICGFSGRAMVMDDDDMIRDVLSNILEYLGLEVIGVREGNELLKKYKEIMEKGENIDVVIMDLTIKGGMGGRDAIKELLKIDPNARVILSSGYVDEELLRELKNYGFSAFLKKPYTIEEISKTLEELLKR